jgi:hypothetical protein
MIAHATCLKKKKKVLHVSFLCPSKNEVAFKITIELAIDHY